MPRLFAVLPLLATAACAGMAPPAQSASAAEPVAASAPATGLDMRIGQLVPVLKGEMPAEDFFGQGFLDAVPPEQFRKLSDSFIKTYGLPLSVVDVKKTSANMATVQLAFEKAVATIDIYVASEAPYKVSGMLAKGFALNEDSIAKIDAEFAGLSGNAGYIVQELSGNGRIKELAARHADQQFAIGSTFKLYILAELAAEIEAGTRKWTDIAPLAHRSFSSVATNRWPKDSPATLHSLATWMISVSDNSATDTLLFLLGREKVEEKLARIGHGDPDKTLPFLSTVEAFALKNSANGELRDRFLKASEAGQRELLRSEADKLAYDKIDPATFTTGPAYVDTLEWFASPEDIVQLFDNIRLTGNEQAMEILAVNPGAGPSSSAKWKYLGYKGGSEPGVISMSYLAQSPSGKWFVISGSWNDKHKAVDDTKFALLMSRLLDKFAE